MLEYFCYNSHKVRLCGGCVYSLYVDAAVVLAQYVLLLFIYRQEKDVKNSTKTNPNMCFLFYVWNTTASMEIASSVAWHHALRLTLKMETVHSTETVVPTRLHGVASRKTVIEWVTTTVHNVRGPYGHVHLFPSESKKSLQWKFNFRTVSTRAGWLKR